MGDVVKESSKFWTLVGFIWLLATICDRFWWNNYAGIPSWDQADYLNSALDHARALGLMFPGEWHGWNVLLDLSPKIPPLASLINGTVMALAGDEPYQAAWSLSIWHGLLLFSVAAWCLQLRGYLLGLIASIFVAFAPALLLLRLDYVLEMPLTASVTFTLWRLGCWWDPKNGGKWNQAFIAAFAFAFSILVKQSALLVLLPAILWNSWTALRRSRATRCQLFVGFIFILGFCMPWLKHNWITTIGGTNRAVIESAVREGDPSLWTLENWTWYINLLPSQIGNIILIVGLSGLILWLVIIPLYSPGSDRRFLNEDKNIWKWLIFNLIASWIFTSISPNKGDRYIAPVLPSLIILLSRGWLEWNLWVQKNWLNRSYFRSSFSLFALSLSILSTFWSSPIFRSKDMQKTPLIDVVLAAGGADPEGTPTTLIVVPSTPDMNQHNVSYYGRRNAGQLVGRQLGSSASDVEPLLKQGELVLLAEGDQGSVRSSALALDHAVRTSGVFEQTHLFPRADGGSYSLWRRKSDAPPPSTFVERFPKLASGLAGGAKGLERVFAEVAVQHMLDGHFEYREIVRQDALDRLLIDSQDKEARWTLALLGILENRASEAATHFTVLESLLPGNPWPSAYLSAVTLAGWNPWQAARIADIAHRRHASNHLLAGLGDLSAVLGGSIWRLPSAIESIPNAVKEIEGSTN